MNHQPQCPRCQTGLDEGPVIYRCSRCRRAVSADVDTEFHAPVKVAA